MVYKFTFLSEERDDFRLVIEADPDATFQELHEAILAAAGYPNDQMTSFFICDDSWEKQAEITLMDMGSDGYYDHRMMADVRLEDVLEEEHDKLLYVFDPMFDRAFFGELSQIDTKRTIKGVQLLKKEGKAPKQLKDNMRADKRGASSQTAGLDIEDDFYGTDDFNADEFDSDAYSLDGTDGMGSIGGFGNSYDDY